MRRLMRRFRKDDRGFSLVELLVVMVLIGVLGSIVTAAVFASNEQVRVAEDEATGLADTRVVVERLGRDIRGSRGVDAGADESTLVLWIDYNSDYVRSASAQPEEIVTWTVLDQGNGHANTLRSTAGGAVQIQSRTLVSDIAFCYQAVVDGTCLPTPLSATDAATVRLVTVNLSYDSMIDYGTSERYVTFSERIRNVS